MKQEHPNVILVHAFFKAYIDNNLNEIEKILDQNIRWHIPGNHPLSGTKKGIPQVLEYFKK